MQYLLNGGSALLLLVPIAVWLAVLYLVLRFLRAFERAAHAHERIADALARPRAGPSDHASTSGAPHEH